MIYANNKYAINENDIDLITYKLNTQSIIMNQFKKQHRCKIDNKYIEFNYNKNIFEIIYNDKFDITNCGEISEWSINQLLSNSCELDGSNIVILTSKENISISYDLSYKIPLPIISMENINFQRQLLNSKYISFNNDSIILYYYLYLLNQNINIISNKLNINPRNNKNLKLLYNNTFRKYLHLYIMNNYIFGALDIVIMMLLVISFLFTFTSILHICIGIRL